jgi:hypothetical protein
MRQIATKAENVIDGFEGWEDRFEGDEQQTSGGKVIQGTLTKFTNEAEWLTKDGAEMAPDRELIVVDIVRVANRWKDQLPVETIILEPGQKFPDIQKLNEKIPQSEWEKGPEGQPKGPWQKQQIVYLLDPLTLDRYCWPTSTAGGDIAIRELVDKVKWMRKFRGGQVSPVVTLSDIFMNTRFGGRQRPHFIIKRWISLGADEKLLPAPTSPASEAEAPKAEPLPGAGTVEEPTLSEQMGDEMPPWNDSPDIPPATTEKKQPPAATLQSIRASEVVLKSKPQMTKRGVQKIAGARR